jgi:hypothetical protein
LLDRERKARAAWARAGSDGREAETAPSRIASKPRAFVSANGLLGYQSADDMLERRAW